jgi:hypothetical protein
MISADGKFSKRNFFVRASVPAFLLMVMINVVFFPSEKPNVIDHEF